MAVKGVTTIDEGDEPPTLRLSLSNASGRQAKHRLFPYSGIKDWVQGF